MDTTERDRTRFFMDLVSDMARLGLTIDDLRSVLSTDTSTGTGEPAYNHDIQDDLDYPDKAMGARDYILTGPDKSRVYTGSRSAYTGLDTRPNIRKSNKVNMAVRRYLDRSSFANQLDYDQLYTIETLFMACVQDKNTIMLSSSASRFHEDVTAALGTKIDIRLIYNLRHAYFDVTKRHKEILPGRQRGSYKETQTMHKYIMSELDRGTDRRSIRACVKTQFGRAVTSHYVSGVQYKSRKMAQAKAESQAEKMAELGTMIQAAGKAKGKAEGKAKIIRMLRVSKKTDLKGYNKVLRFVLARTKAGDNRSEIIKGVADRFDKTITIEMIKTMRRENRVYARKPVDKLTSIDKDGKIRQLIVDEAESGTQVSDICKIIKARTGHKVSPVKVTGFLYRQNRLKSKMVNEA